MNIVGKGNFTGKAPFKVEITDAPVISKMKLTKIPNQAYTGSEIKPVVELKNGKNPLLENQDYKVAYSDNTEVGTATVTITGINGYKGTVTTTFKIMGTALRKAKINGLVSSLLWSETPATQDAVLTYTTGNGANKVTVELKEGKDYEVQYQNSDKVGTATVLFIGKGGFTGTVKKTFKITGIPMNKVVAEKLEPSVVYDGKEMKQSGYLLKYTDANTGRTVPLIEDKDYTVSYKNNTKAGTATIIFTGKNGYTGKLSKTFKITQQELTSGKVSVSVQGQYAYTKGGVTPKPVVTYVSKSGLITLTEGKDYTLKYVNNKNIANLSATKVPTVTITGKGSFKGSLTRTFAITSGYVSAVTMTAPNVVYQNKAGICKPKIVLIDTNGKKLAAGTDYDKTIIYTYVKDTEVAQVVNRKTVYVSRFEGDEVAKEDIIPVGTEILATVNGIKNYGGSQSVIFRYMAGDVAKASIKVANQIYTGKAIEPTKDDITVKIGKVTLAKTDYEIVSYSNNIKKGTAKVTIRGIGNYGGEKTVTFKINSKSMNYTIIFDKNAETATGTMKVASISAGKNLTANAYKNKGYKFVGWNTQADGSGYTYTDKEKFYLQGAMWIFGSQITLYAQWEKM